MYWWQHCNWAYFFFSNHICTYESYGCSIDSFILWNWTVKTEICVAVCRCCLVVCMVSFVYVGIFPHSSRKIDWFTGGDCLSVGIVCVRVCAAIYSIFFSFPFSKCVFIIVLYCVSTYACHTQHSGHSQCTRLQPCVCIVREKFWKQIHATHGIRSHSPDRSFYIEIAHERARTHFVRISQ